MKKLGFGRKKESSQDDNPYAQQPAESVIENVEMFMEHVKPALDEVTSSYTS